MSRQVQRPETLALHAGWRADAAPGAVPIYQTTSYEFPDTEHVAPICLRLGPSRHLYPHHESDQRRAGKVCRRAGRRRCRVRARIGAKRLPPLRCRPATRSSARPISMATHGICSPTHSRIRATRGGLSILPIPAIPAAPLMTRTRACYAETLPNAELTVFPIAEVAEIGRPRRLAAAARFTKAA